MTDPQVSVSPAHRFGCPSMNGVSTEAIADMSWLGENAEADYGLTRQELLVALWFEATQGCPRFRRRWRAWGEMGVAGAGELERRRGHGSNCRPHVSDE